MSITNILPTDKWTDFPGDRTRVRLVPDPLPKEEVRK